ncbi:MAG: acyl-CoA dehydrogenase family protein [Acidimicrobiales bacterium]|nr:acyl-CoA dehydrogenase family protein [Acidimicrobiales bacterium]
MDLTYPAEAEAFRREIRSWLEENLPPGWFQPGFKLEGEDKVRFQKEWTKKLFEGGWICATWPKEYGGKGLSLMESVVLAEEFHRANAPMRADFFGDTLVGPTILQWGTEEQKKYFLPLILQGKIAWCQGFSEPDAGSDLASLKTRAELDGDEWVINGQKIWTTQGFIADYIFVLCRTDPDAPKHKGISYLLCPMKQPGIEVRPIEQIDGSAEFCEVFFTDARCPKENVVGGVNNGWKVAMTTLGFERGMSATTGYRRFEKELEGIIDIARANGKASDPIVRQGLASAYTKVQLMRIAGLRQLGALLSGKKDPSVAALAATNKMFWSEYHQEVMNLAIGILGAEGQILTGDPTKEEAVPGYGARRTNPRYPASVLQSSFFFSRSETIWGGTSQIQRNIVGERILGLPKEPRPEAGAQV